MSNIESNHTVLAVIGPTACGKTALAVQLAKAMDTEVISCDSMQLYAQMQIGTARPTPEEMDGVPHHLLGICNTRSSVVQNMCKRRFPLCTHFCKRGKCRSFAAEPDCIWRAYCIRIISNILPPMTSGESAGNCNIVWRHRESCHCMTCCNVWIRIRPRRFIPTTKTCGTCAGDFSEYGENKDAMGCGKQSDSPTLFRTDDRYLL